MKADLNFSVSFRVGWGNQCLCKTLHKVRRVVHKFVFSLTFVWYVNICPTWTKTKSGNCVQTCTYVHYSTPQESKERERFSIDFWASQSQRRWPQLCHHPSQSAGMMSSHFFHIWVLICCSECAHTHTHAHTQKQSGSQPCLEADDRIIFAILELWHLAGIRSIINNSPAQQCVSVSEWGSVQERTRTSVCIAACAVTICSLWIFGEPAFLCPPPCLASLLPGKG